MFFRREAEQIKGAGSFGYLPENSVYFDSACQTLRPEEVIDAELNYYKTYNACGGRVQYSWGKKVDEEVAKTRKSVLSHFGVSEKEYIVAFTQSTTYAVNLITEQLERKEREQVITTDIEHNSILLPSLAISERWQVPHQILTREPDGSVHAEELPEAPILFMGNATSNIDGRELRNLPDVVAHVRHHGGISLIDAAQTAAQRPKWVGEAKPDIIVFSAHKAYAPSLGVLLVRKEIFAHMRWTITGGGMVEDVSGHHVTFLQGADPALLEPGLQNWAGIIALGRALSWLDQQQKLEPLTAELHRLLRSRNDLLFTTEEHHSTIAFHTPKIGSHVLAKMLDSQGIMVRSGYFCCHHYLKNEHGLPPHVRVSLGHHNTMRDLEHLATVLDSSLRHL
ncbi:hypothetical protein COW46_01125 [Candidatus Gracilibacteria bacterium CG17_big_fil_post_rev_8_21_14_2_50_48_13]|nr:MAG: hypothetical protein COW46_01125 [Candidatus Gracilibacteria bacterium CG17_big_fil_post_rev_8_21_14_2_50_48_13]